MREPPWLVSARKYVGLKEIPGAQTEPTISRWLKSLKAWWDEDETPWCGTAVAAWMKESGYSIPRHWYRAMGWLEWGAPLEKPALGCVVVYTRKGGGHVGLAVGVDAAGNIMTLGGNQGNKVSIAPFDPARVVGYRWPMGTGYLPDIPLPLIGHSQKLSTQES